MPSTTTIRIAVILVALSGCAPAVEPRPAGGYGYSFQDAHAVVLFENQFGSGFKLVALDISLDGKQLYSRVANPGELDGKAPVPVFDGTVASGEHQLGVELRLKGHGEGIFAYLRDYAFKVRSTHDFSVDSEKGLAVKIIGYEKGDDTTPLEQRPEVRYVESDGS